MISLKSYASKTDQGPFLNINEDDVDVDSVNGLFLIFDGFGGAGIGDKTVGLIKESVKRIYTKIGDDPDSTFPFYYSAKYVIEGNALINAMKYAHDKIIKDNIDKDMSKRGGASGIGVSMAENLLTFSGVGNCAAYLYRKGMLEPIILPDSISSLSREYYGTYHQTAPLSGFGLFEDFHLQNRELRIQDGDTIVLLTDGAYARLERRELKYILGNSHLKNIDKINEIFTTVNTRGNRDNQSAVILQF